MNEGTIKRGLQQTIDEQSVVDGKIYLAVDTCRLFFDNQNERIEVTDFVQGLNYDEIMGLEHPLQKLYLSIDTHQLLAYDFANNEWVTYSGGAEDPTVIHEMQEKIMEQQDMIQAMQQTLDRYERVIEIIEQEFGLTEPEEEIPEEESDIEPDENDSEEEIPIEEPIEEEIEDEPIEDSEEELLENPPEEEIPEENEEEP